MLFPFPSEWLKVPGAPQGGQTVLHVTSPSTEQLPGKLQKSAQYPGAARKKKTFPALEGEGDANKGRSNYRP